MPISFTSTKLNAIPCIAIKFFRVRLVNFKMGERNSTRESPTSNYAANDLMHLRAVPSNLLNCAAEFATESQFRRYVAISFWKSG